MGGRSGDLTLRGEKVDSGFGPLLLVAGLVLLGVLAPVLIESGRSWVLLGVPVLLAGVWALLGRYPVEIRRDGADAPLHRTLVAGRRKARQVAEELAEEIARTPDDKLTG